MKNFQKGLHTGSILEMVGFIQKVIEIKTALKTLWLRCLFSAAYVIADESTEIRQVSASVYWSV